MNYLHTMLRITDVEQSLHFYCDQLGLVEISRFENRSGRFTLIFLAAPGDEENAKNNKAPMVELTYNWPDEQGDVEQLTTGRNFGHLAFRVDDIYQTCEQLQASGVTINRPPRDGHMAFVRSPDGVSIELLQKGDNKAPQEPWKSMENVGSW